MNLLRAAQLEIVLGDESLKGFLGSKLGRIPNIIVPLVSTPIEFEPGN
jgi:hypothetical protein